MKPSESATHHFRQISSIRRRFYIIIGFFFVVIGIIGIILPLLPTTPFLLLSAYFFSRSSQRFHSWLLNHKILGSYIKNYTKKREIPLKAILTTLTIMWVTLFVSMLLLKWTLWSVILLSTVGILTTVHLFKIWRRSKRHKDDHLLEESDSNPSE